MNITYVLLSPTFGMHQYTADLAGRVTQWSGDRGQWSENRPLVVNHVARLVTTATLPRDRYGTAVVIDTPITAHGTGFTREGLDLAAYRRASAAISHQRSAIVHFTGVHAWNLPLVYGLRRRGIPVVHTLHDLDPHTGVRYPALIRLWNRLIIASGCHLLVHGGCTRDRLIAQGVSPDRVTYTPLLHGFLGAAYDWPPVETGCGGEGECGSVGEGERGSVGVRECGSVGVRECGSVGEGENGRNAECKITVLFFGRIEAYKGVEDLLAAWAQVRAASFDYVPHTDAGLRASFDYVLPTDAGLRASFDYVLPTDAGLRSSFDYVLPTDAGLRSGCSGPAVGDARLIIAGPVARGVTLGELPPGVELRDRRIDDEEGDALFRGASLLVLPYRDATQSALIAAAYAYGLPVIVTRTGALAECVIAGETGWVAPPGNSASLAATLAEALSEPHRLARMGAAGRAWFVAQRSAEEATLTAMYRRVSA